jgi:hypothetical protein
LDGPLPKWCPAVALSRQDGCHSAVALLLKAALIQVSDYRLLGASGYSFSLRKKRKYAAYLELCLLYILEKNNVSESAYRELKVFCDGLPRKYLVSSMPGRY